MLVKQLALAATAAAFIVVPEISEGDEGIFRALPIESSGEPFEYPPSAMAQTIEVPCRQCRGRDTHLEMAFAIRDSQQLVLNDFELYPNADPWHGDLVASVVSNGHNGKVKEDRLGYSLAVRPEAMDDDQHFEVIAVDLRIIEVGSRFVEGVPAVKVKLLKAPGGDIVIGSVNVDEESSGEPSGDACATLWCRVHGFFDDAVKDLKDLKKGFAKGGCSKVHHGHHQQQHTSPAPHEDEELGQDQVEHEKDRVHHPWAHMMTNFTSYIFIPILMGITAGVGVAMYVYTLIIRRFVY